LTFGPLDFAGVFAVRPRSINPQLPRNIVVAWTIEFEHMSGVF
jgi:hypothetical protein